MFDLTTKVFIEAILMLLLAYLVGSIPSGLLIGKGIFKTDVREYGSKNIGATNTYRVLGLKAAIPVFLCDAAKGVIGVNLLNDWGPAAIVLGELAPLFMVLGGLCAMIGHNWSVFLHFKGGRGVATGLGVLIGLSPIVAFICFALWGIIVYATKLVSLGSILAAFLVPFAMYFFGYPIEFVGFGALAAAFVIFRHKENIIRLVKGEELKVERVKEE